LGWQVFYCPSTIRIAGGDDLHDRVVKGAVFELRYVYLSRDAERVRHHAYIRITAVCEAVSTRRVVDPNPIRAIVSQPVLASVLIITSGTTHFEGLLPAGSKAF